MTPRKAALVLLSAVALAACTTRGVWVKPGVDEEQLQADRSACLRYAHTVAGEEIRRTTVPPRQRINPNTGRVEAEQPLDVRASQLAEASRRAELFETCMRQLGYERRP